MIEYLGGAQGWQQPDSLRADVIVARVGSSLPAVGRVIVLEKLGMRQKIIFSLHCMTLHVVWYIQMEV